MSQFRPYPKSQSLKKDHNENTYPCSDGSRITQEELNMRIRAAKARKGKKRGCEAYGPAYSLDDHGPIDNDHTISCDRCKEIGKSELAYDVRNMVHNSRVSHMEWEAYKSGEFQNHLNVVERMKYVKEHDPEGYELRKNYITNLRILEQI